MNSFLDKNQIKILQAVSSSLWMANSSKFFGTEIIRLTGGKLTEDEFHLHLFVPEKYASCFLKNLEANEKVSFLFACVHTFTAFQIKGMYMEHRYCTVEENAFQQNYVAGFAETMDSIGIKSGASFKQYWEEPALCFLIRPKEIYEQTPKPGAGNKIN